MTNNGDLSIACSHTPTPQNVDNEGRNASEPENVGFCDSGLLSVSCLLFKKSTSTVDEATPQVAAPICSAVFSTDADNGRLGIDGSGLPTSQNVNNQGRNTSKPRHGVDYSGWTNDDLELVESLLSS
ncbi:hypothetical protein Droror1_Dr00014333 [Drosera rotundifolia]